MARNASLYPMLLFQLQVYLLKPGSKAQEQFEKLVNLLEQFVYLHVNVVIFYY